MTPLQRARRFHEERITERLQQRGLLRTDARRVAFAIEFAVSDDVPTDEIRRLADALEQRAKENEELDAIRQPLVLTGPGGDFVNGVQPDDIRWVAAIGFVASAFVIVAIAVALGLKFLPR